MMQELNAHEIEGHGRYWEVSTNEAGGYLSTHSTLDSVKGAYPRDRIAVFTYATWEAASAAEGDDFGGTTPADYYVQPVGAVASAFAAATDPKEA